MRLDSDRWTTQRRAAARLDADAGRVIDLMAPRLTDQQRAAHVTTLLAAAAELRAVGDQQPDLMIEAYAFAHRLEQRAERIQRG